jgi:AraC-like DNA-binding protein
MTVTEYLQRFRVNKARDLLQFSTHPVEEIAWNVGYTDGSAFRKVFQRIVGLSRPSTGAVSARVIRLLFRAKDMLPVHLRRLPCQSARQHGVAVGNAPLIGRASAVS